MAELRARLASAKKTDGHGTLKPLADRWRAALVDCLRAFHEHEQCPTNPDTGKRITLQQLAETLVEADLDHLGIDVDSLE